MREAFIVGSIMIPVTIILAGYLAWHILTMSSLPPPF